MATFSAVTRQHILQAIAEYDSRGRDDFLGVYGYAPAAGYTLVHEARTYDPAAVVGVAHRYATGRLATADDLSGKLPDIADLLQRRGFDVSAPPSAVRPVAAPKRAAAARTPSTRTTARTTTRRVAAPEPVVAICPTCSMVLPATGVCDDCG